MLSILRSVLSAPEQFQSLRSDPQAWLKWGVQWRRLLHITFLIGLSLILNVLGDPENPWFSIVMLLYVVYLFLLEGVSHISSRYHNSTCRLVRIHSHLICAALILAFSHTATVSLLMYLPWMITAAIYFESSWAILIPTEATILTIFVFWQADVVPSEQLWAEGALVAIGLMGGYLFTAYLWRQMVSEWQSRVRQMETLQTIGNAISEAAVITEVYPKIFLLIKKLIPFEAALLLGWDSTQEFLVPQANYGYDPDFLRQQNFRFRLGEGLAGHVASSKTATLIEDVENYVRVRPKYPYIGEGRLLGSFIAMPLVFEDELIGVFELMSDQVDVFSREHLEILEWLATQIAIAIRNTQLQEQLRKQVQEVERQYQELKDLYDISVAMALKGTDIKSLLRTIVVSAAHLLNANRAALLLNYPREKKLRMIITHNFDELNDWKFDYDSSMSGKVAAKGKHLLWNDYLGEEGKDRRLDVEPYRGLLRAVVNVPLQWQGDVLGVLTVAHSEPDRSFDDKDRKRLERFANQAALAIGNARLNNYRERLVRISPDAIIRIDEEGHIVEFNDASQRMLGFTLEEAQKDYVAHYYYKGEEEARKIKRELIRAGDTGISGYLTHVKTKSGEKIPIEFFGMLLQDEAMQGIGSFGIMVNKKHELELLATARKNMLLTELERYPYHKPVSCLDDLRERLSGQMEQAHQFCKVRYLVLFANKQDGETVLPAIAWVGVPKHVAQNLPHFNWRKAFTQRNDESDEEYQRREAEEVSGWDRSADWKQRAISAIRGVNREFFTDADCCVPLTLAGSYRSVLVFGPPVDPTDNKYDVEFLGNINLTIATGALSWLQALYLHARQKEVELANALIVHRTKVNLLKINGKLGLVKRYVSGSSAAFRAASEGEDLVDEVAHSVPKALAGNVMEVERQDYNFERFSLATLILNCVEGFELTARSNNRRLLVERPVELLPYAYVDPTFLGIAFSNLLDNAIKYSFPDSFIRVSSEFNRLVARIFIEDKGDEMPMDARKCLHEPGLRWKLGRRQIPGMGIGLWEANLIIENHGGSLDFASTRHPHEQAHIVRVWVEIPLSTI